MSKLGVSRVIPISTILTTRTYLHSFLRPNELLLTFDDGPHPINTVKTLDALANHCTKATFFFTGSVSVQHTSTVQQTYLKGHNVGSHTWSHKDHTKIPPSSAKRELELGISAVGKALGKQNLQAPIFRFPFLADAGNLHEHMEKRGIKTLGITLDSLDYRITDVEQLVANVERGLDAVKQYGGVLLMHEGHNWTAQAVPLILDKIKEKGIEIVHLQFEKDEAVKGLKCFDRLLNRIVYTVTRIRISTKRVKQWPKIWSKVHYSV